MKVRPIHPEFAAEIGGIELSRFVDHAVVDTIWEAIDRYAVLVFHDQHLDDEGLRNFASNFGELEIGRAADSHSISSTSMVSPSKADN
jgi:alpha-ketoglutarate-dependent 2,4-dichlorophenoxyacetate dioxygenase